MFVLEGLTIAVLATVAAPLVAAAAISLMGLTPAFSDLTGGGLLDIRLSSTSFMLGALGGVLGLVALVLPAFQVSRTGVIRHRQEAARPTALPAFQRYYVDVLLLIVSIYLFRQLTEQGSVVATDLLGESAVSELLLALPGLTLIAAAVVLLRIFPIAMNLAGRLLSGSIPAGLVMGIWQMARSPTHYARLSLLLILAAGLGIFASSFGATLERSFLERVLHSTGADVKVEGIQGRDFTEAGSAALSAEYAGVQGVGTATAVLRKGGQDLSRLVGIPFEMFAVDPAVFGGVAFFREDYADGQIEALLPRLDHSPPAGLELPAGAASLTVRVKPDRPHPGVRMTAQVRDGGGEHRTPVAGQARIRRLGGPGRRNTRRTGPGAVLPRLAADPRDRPLRGPAGRFAPARRGQRLHAWRRCHHRVLRRRRLDAAAKHGRGHIGRRQASGRCPARRDGLGAISPGLRARAPGYPRRLQGRRAPADSGPCEQAVCPGHGPRRGR